MEKTMHEFKVGKLHSGSKKGPIVKSRKQAIRIGLEEERRAGKGPAKPKMRGLIGKAFKRHTED